MKRFFIELNAVLLFCFSLFCLWYTHFFIKPIIPIATCAYFKRH